MAEAIVSVVTEELLKKLISLASQEITLAWGFKGEVRKLRDSLSSIQAVLEDAETRQVKDKFVNLWLKGLKDVSYDADDVLDGITTEFLIRKMETQTPMMKKVRKFFSPSNPIAFRLKMAHKIKGINGKLELIKKKKDEFQFSGSAVSTTNLEIREDRKTHSFFEVDDPPPVGREDEILNVVNVLLNSPDQETISVLPIVGMAGLGKTTLARLAFHDESVKKHFNLRMWVCVSNDFNVERLIKEIIESATETTCNLLNFDVMVRNLQNKLRGKRVLLVLDDVWNEDRDKWSTLKTSLGDGVGRGSKILVTSRMEIVARIMGTLPMYLLTGLSEDHCWSIFSQRAFGNMEVRETPLVQIGKQIVKKCRGLPLAAKTLGGLMSYKREEKEWLLVRDSEIWKLPQDENNKILPELKLSYEYLPSHLKQCFSYCSIFPKDCEIEKDMLIKLWMAEGFVQPVQGDSRPPEDIANEYFNSLVWRSLFQDVKKDRYGDIERCKMHDLVHDLAQSVNGNECSIVEADKLERVHEKTRHLSFVNEVRGQTLQNALQIIKGSYLRTFLVLDGMEIEEFPNKLLFSYKCLRVLELSNSKLGKLSPSIGKLIHLRYLDLSHTDIRNLPKSITNLYNLQTLKLLGCENILEFPKGFSKMINLRHLEIDMHCKSMAPKDIGQLTNLQMLPTFRVGKDNRCGLDQLGSLQYLKGTLVILSLDNLRNREEATKAKLKDKENLRCLELSWSLNTIDENVDVDVDDVMEGLQPPPNIKELKINGFPGVNIPSWMTMMGGGNGGLQQQQQLPSLLLSSLMFLEIKHCHNLQSLSNMRGFPFLMSLEISKCEKLISLPDQELGNLASLQSLKIWDCPNLTSLMDWIQGLTLLQMLEIVDFPNLTSLTAGIQVLTSLQVLKILGCPNLRSLAPGIQGHVSLQVLEIVDCPNLTSLPVRIQGLTSLRLLTIANCSNLTAEVQNLTSLQMHEIVNCPNLESLPAMIQGLTIAACSNFMAEIQSLTSLQVLEIFDCHISMAQIKGLTSLQVLKIVSCSDSMVEIQGLTSLQLLKIDNCRSMSAEIQGLTSLQVLEIVGCSFLMAKIQGFTSLQILKMVGCSNTAAEIQGSIQMLETADCTDTLVTSAEDS